MAAPTASEPKKVGSAKRKSPHPSAVTKQKVKKVKDPTEQIETEREHSKESSKKTEKSADKGEKIAVVKDGSESLSSSKSESGSPKSEKTTGASEPTEKTKSNKLNEFNMFEKLSEDRKGKTRPKTAKTYTSRFRSTGINIQFLSPATLYICQSAHCLHAVECFSTWQSVVCFFGCML